MLLTWIGDERVLTELIATIPSYALLIIMAICIFVLWRCADIMIEGSVNLALRTGLPKIVIGATIISLGTTFPEMFVSVVAAWMGNPGLALGNGVGSIICDTGMIFGLICILVRVPVNRYLLNRTGWVQVGSATLLVVISFFAPAASNGHPVLSRPIGLFLLCLLVLYMFLTYRWSGGGYEPEEVSQRHLLSLKKSSLMVAGGLIGVAVASRVLVPSAAEGARRLGVPPDVIAATLVAFGTSLPELITAIASVRKGHPEIMVGNIVGADVLNCLFVIGAAALARPLTVEPTFFIIHYPAMLFILYSFRFFIHTNKDGWFKRWQGIWVFSAYIIYVVLQYALNIGTDQ